MVYKSSKEKAIRRFFKTNVNVVGLFLVILVFGITLYSFFYPVDPNVMDATALRKPPGTPDHLLGTDTLGRDILARVLHGSRISMTISITVVTLSTIIGMFFGLIAGYFGGVIDAVIGRIVDMLLSFPGILLLLVIMATFGSGVWIVIFAMTLGGIPGTIRLMRERVLGLRSRNYIIAASCLGADGWYNMRRHILPNAITPILVSAALAIPGAIMGEAGLSYLGLGVPPPAPSWGKMIADGQSLIEFAPWISIFPGICILMTTLGFNLLGDGIRDFLDPTQLH
jgi:peptide/nickel transport system permease protein